MTPTSPENFLPCTCSQCLCFYRAFRKVKPVDNYPRFF